MISTRYYRADMGASEGGLIINLHEWCVIRETEHVVFCVQDGQFAYFNTCGHIKGESALQRAKRMKIKIKRINKQGSRYAFDTKDAALGHLRMRKKRQIVHLQRDLMFARRFICEVPETPVYADYAISGRQGVVPGTRGLVMQHYSFD